MQTVRCVDSDIASVLVCSESPAVYVYTAGPGAIAGDAANFTSSWCQGSPPPPRSSLMFTCSCMSRTAGSSAPRRCLRPPAPLPPRPIAGKCSYRYLHTCSDMPTTVRWARLTRLGALWASRTASLPPGPTGKASTSVQCIACTPAPCSRNL